MKHQIFSPQNSIFFLFPSDLLLYKIISRLWFQIHGINRPFCYVLCFCPDLNRPCLTTIHKPHTRRGGQSKHHATSKAMSAPTFKLTPNWPTEDKVNMPITRSISGWKSAGYEVLEKEAWEQVVGSLILYRECFTSNLFIQLLSLILYSALKQWIYIS